MSNASAEADVNGARVYCHVAHRPELEPSARLLAGNRLYRTFTYKAYNLLSSGFSRSREFLADRMAAGLYGSGVFATALKKVCTEGTLFEMTMYDNVGACWPRTRRLPTSTRRSAITATSSSSAEEREKVYNDILTEKESLFASQPTFRERIEAVVPLPKAEKPDDTPAARLFENAEALEKELTEFITGYVAYVQRMRSQAAQQ